MALTGHCLCRRVTVEIARSPEYINICNCDFCRKRGAAWAYFRIAEVTVSGTTQEYRREDIDDVWLIGHHCPTCGTTTHYTFVPEHATDRVGVNTRLFAQDDFDGIEVRYKDGRHVVTWEDEFILTATGEIGDGKAF